VSCGGYYSSSLSPSLLASFPCGLTQQVPTSSRFAATEAKMLRVSVSSFYDFLTVALKCYQEFDFTLTA
jgi:hypothetical protein